MNRRNFLRSSVLGAAGAIGFPYIVPAQALGLEGGPAPSERITMGCIGTGGQGQGNMKNFLGLDACQVIAVCDVDAKNMGEAKKLADEKYGNTDCATYPDFRELLARDDIDTVSLAAPDHWHAIPAIEAAKRGKDIYGEKPLSHDFREGRAMCDAVAKYGRIWQTGSWQRSQEHFRRACEMVRNGRIGKIIRVEVGLPSGHRKPGMTADPTLSAPRKGLDYDFWLGPAPYSPYCDDRIHFNWRWYLDTGGGQLMDWVGHHVDIAHWGMGWDRTGPVSIEGVGEYPPAESIWNSPTRYRLTAEYPGGIPVIIAGGHDDIRAGTKWIGTDGWVWVNRAGWETYPESLQDDPTEMEIRLYRSTDHFANFLKCVKTRQETITPAETAHRSATPGHLGMIAMTLGRKIYFNPATEEIVNDAKATSLLGRAYRSPWVLEK